MSTTEKDLIIYENAAKQMEVSPVAEHQQLFLEDENRKSYVGGLVRFNSRSLAQNGRRNDYASSCIALPFVTIISAFETATPANIPDLSGLTDFKLALKSGYKCVNSLRVKINSQDILPQQSHLDLTTSFNIAIRNNDEDDQFLEKVIHAKETAESVFYNPGASRDGHGLCNNRNSTPFTTSLSANEVKANAGFAKRCKLMSNAITATNGIASLVNANSTILSDSVINHIVKTAGYIAVYSTVYIPLTDLSNLFDGFSLNFGTLFELEVQVNQSEMTFVTTGATSLVPSTLLNTGYTTPLHVASTRVSNGMEDMMAVENRTITISHNLVGAQWSRHKALNVPEHPWGSCRWIIDSYLLNPEAELRYISNNQIVQFNYSHYNQMPNIVANVGQNRHLIASSSIENVKSMVIFPQLVATDNDGIFDTLQTPWYSGNCAPSWFTNVQVYIDGVSMFQQPLSSMDELYKLLPNGSVNANTSKNIKGGLTVEEYKFGPNKGYFFDLSRGEDLNSTTKHNISISFTNSGLKPYQLYCFLEESKQFSYDSRTGATVV